MDGAPAELGAWSIPSAMRIRRTADRFSWFDYRSKGFDDNRGLRIDLLLGQPPAGSSVASKPASTTKFAAMEKPSDHAPVWATFRR